MTKEGENITRRKMLKGAAAAGLGGSIMPFAGLANIGAKKKEGLIEEENSKPGTLEWQLQYTAFDTPLTMASYPMVRNLRSLNIEGFVTRTSLFPGESLDFKISMNPIGKFYIDIYRMGYYGGKGGRHMAQLGSFSGHTQDVPLMTVERLRECNWETATTFTIPQDWPSGVYLGKLSRDEPFGKQSYVIFVVKERRQSDLLCQVSDLTWQSYNKWPSRDSLYDDGSTDVWFVGPGVRVSFDRPYAKYPQLFDATLSAGSGEYLLWEHPMTYWLEQQGYDVTYCSNLDLHFDSGILNRSKVLLSVGHDEYWTPEMFNNAIKARDNGLSIAFFCGNSVGGEIQLYDSFEGIPGRVFSRTQKARFDNEEILMGNTSYGVGFGDWLVKKPEHWIYEGTGLKAGDKIPAIIGWEYHGMPVAKIPGLEVVAEGPLSAPSKELHAAVVYPGPQGNWVFNAGTIWWTEGLANPPGHIPAGESGQEEFLRPGSYPAAHDPGGRTFGVMPEVQKITANVLNRMIKDSPKKW
jgi:hypothetical protein